MQRFWSISSYGIASSFIGGAFCLSNFKIGGGLYLLWLAFKIIKHAKEPIAMENDGKSKMTYKQAYRYGLITQLSNPKIAVVLASVFTALLPKEIPNYYYVALPVICFMIDAGWYSCVAMLLSSEKPRTMYLKAKLPLTE